MNDSSIKELMEDLKVKVEALKIEVKRTLFWRKVWLILFSFLGGLVGVIVGNLIGL
jgi:hypothetical protein